MSNSKKLFCFGYGYTADALVRQLKAEGGWDFTATTRDPAKRVVMEEHGIQTYLFSDEYSLNDPATVLTGATHILISTPPDDLGDLTFRLYAEDIRQIKGVEWIGYLSATNVYGDRGGDWVDESSDPHPSNRRGTRRLRAEQQWRGLYELRACPVHIFRLAGIYGPGRSALESVRAGAARRINKPGQAFSRIHVDDIVQILRASMTSPKPGGIYNVADDYPAPSHEVIAYTCELLGKPIPPLLDYASADLAPITMSFYSDNKRVRNDRIKDELKVRLRYPTFREGLLAVRAVEEGNDPGNIPGYWFAEGRDIADMD